MQLQFNFGFIFDYHVNIKKAGPYRYKGYWWSEIKDTFKKVG